MKKIKALILFTVMSGALVMSSCKKDKNASVSATITANIDGTATNFNTHAMAIKGTQQTANMTVIQGSGANGTNMSITILGTVTAGQTYVSGGQNSDTAPLVVYTTANDSFLNDDDDPANLISVTITSVSSTSIKGTFKGKLTNIVIGNVTPTTHLISNGQFNVSY